MTGKWHVQDDSLHLSGNGADGHSTITQISAQSQNLKALSSGLLSTQIYQAEEIHRRARMGGMRSDANRSADSSHTTRPHTQANKHVFAAHIDAHCIAHGTIHMVPEGNPPAYTKFSWIPSAVWQAKIPASSISRAPSILSKMEVKYYLCGIDATLTIQIWLLGSNGNPFPNCPTWIGWKGPKPPWRNVTRG